MNDNFGHFVGNKLLQQIAKNLKNACREYDQVGRLGGDEFVFVLPELAKDGAEELTPRLELAVEEAGQSICGAKVVTASIGCAFYPKDGSTADELLSEADHRMYETKETYYKRRREAPRLQIVD